MGMCWGMEGGFKSRKWMAACCLLLLTAAYCLLLLTAACCLLLLLLLAVALLLLREGGEGRRMWIGANSSPTMRQFGTKVNTLAVLGAYCLLFVFKYNRICASNTHPVRPLTIAPASNSAPQQPHPPPPLPFIFLLQLNLEAKAAAADVVVVVSVAAASS